METMRSLSYRWSNMHDDAREACTCLPCSRLGAVSLLVSAPARLHWVGSGRVTLRHVSPIPPLDPYVRLSPHTAHDRGILWERSISPAPRCIPHGQLCAFAGYLCTVSLPSPSGPSPCARFSRTRTTRFPVVIAKFWAVSSACENKPGGVSQIVIAVTV